MQKIIWTLCMVSDCNQLLQQCTPEACYMLRYTVFEQQNPRKLQHRCNNRRAGGNRNAPVPCPSIPAHTSCLMTVFYSTATSDFKHSCKEAALIKRHCRHQVLFCSSLSNNYRTVAMQHRSHCSHFHHFSNFDGGAVDGVINANYLMSQA